MKYQQIFVGPFCKRRLGMKKRSDLCNICVRFFVLQNDNICSNTFLYLFYIDSNGWSLKFDMDWLPALSTFVENFIGLRGQARVRSHAVFG